MKLLVVSSAPFIYKEDRVFAYGPYVSEMKLWAKYCDNISFCCPVWNHENGLLTTALPFTLTKHYRLTDFNLTSAVSFFKSIFFSTFNFLIIVRAMFAADHIHLRCPGNVGLLGCVAQLFFPFKTKTAKYAGNWDFKARQPFSYLLQKRILSSFFTRKMQVLVYGEWLNQTKNIKPFFTATYNENDKIQITKPPFKDGVAFVFAGMLVEGKNPLYAIQIVEQLRHNGFNVNLSLYGEGIQRSVLENYIAAKELQAFVFLKGNQPAEVLKTAYKESHFVLLPSQSEGWPKVIAEGMFWGAVPIVTPVSCVPFMLDYGNRGLLLDSNLGADVLKIQSILKDLNRFESFSSAAVLWSQEYTVERFESEIKKMLS